MNEKTKEEVLEDHDICFNDLEESQSAERALHAAMDEWSTIVLDATINTPQTADFIESVKCEMIHQQQRWGDESGKYPHDFALVLGYLQGKLIKAIYDKNAEKFIHHVITMAAMAGVIHKYFTEDSNTHEYFHYQQKTQP
jgi:hypothetical protein